MEQQTDNTTEQYQPAISEEDKDSGSDLPRGSGTVSDEDVNAVSP